MYRDNEDSVEKNKIEHSEALNGELTNFSVNLVANVFRPEKEGKQEIALSRLDSSKMYDLEITWDSRRYYQRNIGKDEILTQIRKMKSKEMDFCAYVAEYRQGDN
ncbi:MAG: hypothetical protein QXD13_02230 [Candidatus Pacearchaeota archaeon]